jgi:hypothetical protein
MLTAHECPSLIVWRWLRSQQVVVEALRSALVMIMDHVW